MTNTQKDCSILLPHIQEELQAAADRGDFKSLEVVYYFLLNGENEKGGMQS